MAYAIKGSLSVAKDVSGQTLTINGNLFRNFSLVADAQAANGSAGNVCFVAALANWFVYSAASGATVDGTTVLSTADGGTTRWVITAPPQTPVVYSNSNPSAITVGGIASNSTFTNQTMQQMWDNLLYPELFPTLTAPSSGFTSSVTGFREIGEVISSISFQGTFSQGSISPAYGTSGLRSGPANTYHYTGTGLTSTVADTNNTDSQTVSSYTVLSGSQSWSCTVSYDAGPQPKSSKGNNFSTPRSAGTTSATTRTITGVYPVFATTSGITTMTKQGLQTTGSSIDTALVAESGSDKQKVDFPTGWGTITILQQYNTLSGQFDTIDLGTFTTSSVTETVQGNVVSYTRYTNNGALIGARTLRWRVS